MKKFNFFFKCILACLPILAVILFTAFVPYGYMDSEYPAWDYTKNVCKDVSNIYPKDGPVSALGNANPTLILGDSRAMADLIPSMMGDELTVNLAVGGATSIEMYYTLNTYIKNNTVPEKVIIMFAPFHYSVIDNFWTRAAYFNYLSIPDLYDLYGYAKAAQSETLTKNGYMNDLLSYRLRFPDKYIPALMNSKFIGRYSSNKEEYYNVAMDLGYGEFGTADGDYAWNYEVSYDRMHTSGDAVLLDMYMNRLLNLCEDNGIETIVAVPPMNEVSYYALKEAYVDDFSSYMYGLKIKHPAITIDGDIPCYLNEYFGDPSHLNHKGAMMFTEDFVSSHLK